MQTFSDHPLGPFLSNAYGDHFLYPVNRETFNTVGAHTLYSQRFGNDLFEEKTLHIVVGLDSGLLLEYVRKRRLPEGSRYLFVELPQILDVLRQAGRLGESDDRIACVTPQEFSAQANTFQFANYLYSERVKLWQSFAGGDGFFPGYAELYWQTRNTVDTMAWQIKVQLGHQVFIQRQLENLADNRYSAHCLTGAFAGKTAVLLAGGPSLDEVLPWVKRHRDQVVVLAVSRIARRLRDVDLAPDLFFSVDPHPISFDVSKEMLTFWEHSLFVNKHHVSPPLLSQWRGRSVFVGARFPWEQEGGADYLQAPGPTVTNTAFAVAVAMGFKQIVLAGVDLCFSASGHSHAKGSNESLAGPQFGHFDTQVETNDGSKAFTMRSMAEAIPTLGYQAGQALQVGCCTVNPAAGAARIPHVEHRPLADIRCEPLERPARETLAALLPEETPQSRTTYYRSMRAELDKAQRQLHRIAQLAAEGLKCNDGLFGRNGMQADFKHKKRMDKVENGLNRPSMAPYSRLVREFALRQFVKISRPDTDADGEWSDEDIEETGRIYYQAYLEGAGQLLEYLQQATERLQLRLDEEHPGADPAQLAQRWQSLDEPGRALLWQQRHPGQAGPACLHALQEAFEQILNDRNTHHLQQRQKDADPTIARHKARMLFKNRDPASLTGLVEGLAELPGDQAVPIRHLAAGYLHELQGHAAKALEAYHAVIEGELPQATEDALRRIASLSLELEDHANALLALECLAGLSPIYLPQYAELARLLDQTGTALDAYARYLETFPDDQVVLIKVGKLYHDIGQAESAATIFRYLLAKDPHNEAARSLLVAAEESAAS